MAVNFEQELAYEKKQRQTLARLAHSYMIARDVAIGRIAELEAERDKARQAHAASHDEAADWRRLYAEKLGELSAARQTAATWKRSAKMWRRIAANLTPWDIMSLWKSEPPFYDDGKRLKHRGVEQ